MYDLREAGVRFDGDFRLIESCARDLFGLSVFVSHACPAYPRCGFPGPNTALCRSALGTYRIHSYTRRTFLSQGEGPNVGCVLYIGMRLQYLRCDLIQENQDKSWGESCDCDFYMGEYGTLERPIFDALIETGVVLTFQGVDGLPDVREAAVSVGVTGVDVADSRHNRFLHLLWRATAPTSCSGERGDVTRGRHQKTARGKR